jgi:hypothetical protein
MDTSYGGVSPHTLPIGARDIHHQQGGAHIQDLHLYLMADEGRSLSMVPAAIAAVEVVVNHRLRVTMIEAGFTSPTIPPNSTGKTPSNNSRVPLGSLESNKGGLQ